MTSQTLKHAIFVLGLIGERRRAETGARRNPTGRRCEAALRQVGQTQPGGVFASGMPRTDLAVTVKGVPVKAGFALGSLCRVQPVGDQAMVMGDLVLLDQEVPAVMAGLFREGWRSPHSQSFERHVAARDVHCHYEGHGEAVKRRRRFAGTLRQRGRRSVLWRVGLPPRPRALA